MYGKPINVARFHRQWMMDAGFDQVQEVVRRVRRVAPLSPFSHVNAMRQSVAVMLMDPP